MSKKYHLYVYGDPLQVLPEYKTAIKTCVFKSSFCAKNTIIFDSENERIKVKNYLKKRVLNPTCK